MGTTPAVRKTTAGHQNKRGDTPPPLDRWTQFVSVTAAGAAPLPDISFRESAAQTLERAMATKATVMMMLRTTGRWLFTMSRTLDIRRVHIEHSYSARTVKTYKSCVVLDSSGATVLRRMSWG